MLGLVPLGIARPPPAAQQRDGQQEEDDAAEADPVPGLPLAGGLGGGLGHRRAMRVQVSEDARRDLGQRGQLRGVGRHDRQLRRVRGDGLQLRRVRGDGLQRRRGRDHAGDGRLVGVDRGQDPEALGAAPGGLDRLGHERGRDLGRVRVGGQLGEQRRVGLDHRELGRELLRVRELRGVRLRGGHDRRRDRLRGGHDRRGDLLGGRHDGRVRSGEGQLAAVLGRVGRHGAPVVHQRGDGVDHHRDEQVREEHHDPDDPAPDGQAGGGQRRVAGLHGLGVAGHPRGVGHAEAERQQRQHDRQGVVARVVAGLLQVDHGHDRGYHPADHHERLAHPEPVRDEADQDHRDDVEPPVPVAQPVGVLDREPEHGRQVDHGEPDGGVVDQQHDRYGDRGDDDVGLEQLAERVLQCRLDVLLGQALGPGLDQRAVMQGHHQLVAQRRGQFPQPDERDHEHDQPGDAADAVLVGPEPGVGHDRGNGGAAHHRHDQAAHHRAAGPEAHGRGPAHLRGEVADQRGGGHQADALDEADHEGRDGERPLAGHGRDYEEREHPGEQQPDHHHVGPAEPVAKAGAQRAERPDQGPEGYRQREEREAHVQVDQVQRGHRAAHVQLVVQRDRGQYRDGQVHHPGPGIRISVQLPSPDPGKPSGPAGHWRRSDSCHAVTSDVGA